ncbi:phasin family protein [Methylobrevis albus]|uniref:Phasin family protein n=1 Tax=Methylobrevis albus TaxID=2793297 RepID=A0A931I4D4_9HYPH|nr:phasin family protein [Methylobrevis albus]MBH0240030.1 phasin family protein [Methylobrevis albus]
MATGYEDVQKILKENIDAAMKSADLLSKSLQTIATEATDYSKKSAEETTKHFEKLMGVKSVEAAIELQTEFVKKSYEGAVSQATKMTELYVDLSKDLAKPYEGVFAKIGK